MHGVLRGVAAYCYGVTTPHETPSTFLAITSVQTNKQIYAYFPSLFRLLKNVSLHCLVLELKFSELSWLFTTSYASSSSSHCTYWLSCFSKRRPASIHKPTYVARLSGQPACGLAGSSDQLCVSCFSSSSSSSSSIRQTS